MELHVKQCTKCPAMLNEKEKKLQEKYTNAITFRNSLAKTNLSSSLKWGLTWDIISVKAERMSQKLGDRIESPFTITKSRLKSLSSWLQIQFNATTENHRFNMKKFHKDNGLIFNKKEKKEREKKKKKMPKQIDILNWWALAELALYTMFL